MSPSLPARSAALFERRAEMRSRKGVAALSLLALILAILLALAMELQNAIRASVAGEASWSQAEAEAAYELSRYAGSGAPGQFAAFRQNLGIPLAAARARAELDKAKFDAEQVRHSLVDGGFRPGDAQRIRLFHRLRGIEFMKEADAAWKRADREILQLEVLGDRLRTERSGAARPAVLQALLSEVDGVNTRLLVIEGEFSGVLVQATNDLGSRMIVLLALVAACVAAATFLVMTGLRARLGTSAQEIELYADFVRNTQIGLHVWRLEEPGVPESLRLVAANAAANAMVPAEPAGGTILEVLPGLRGTGWPRLFSELISLDESRDLGLLHYADPALGKVTLSVKAFALPGRRVGVSFEDVTEHDRAERELRESRSFLERSQAVAHIGSWISELSETASLTWSEEVFRIFGVEPRDFTNRLEDFYRRVHPDDLEAVREAAGQAIAERRAFSITHRIVRPSGEVRWVHEEADVESDDDKRAVRLIGVVQDVTSRRELEEQLLQSQKMEGLGQLAGGVAHDFNNLLTAILGYGNLLLRAIPPGDSRRSGVEEILAAGHRAAALTRQLLAFSRHQVLEPRVLDLNALVEGMRALLHHLIGEDIELETRLAPGMCRVRADNGQIEQVIMNLAINARDAMPFGGKLLLQTTRVEVAAMLAVRHGRQPGPYVCLRVSDNGVGMDAEVRSRIFEPFFSTKDRSKGTGLGLATVYGIVQQSGGLIEVESAPRAGTRFDLYLPSVVAALDGAVREDRPEASAATGETVLLVEDDKLVRDLVHEILSTAGYRVLSAENGEAALGLARDHRGVIHLLVSDVIMPGMSGPDLFRKFGAERPEAGILFLSGYTDDALARHGVIDGANFLQKPFSPGLLLAKVRASLAAAEAREKRGKGGKERPAPGNSADPGQDEGAR